MPRTLLEIDAFKAADGPGTEDQHADLHKLVEFVLDHWRQFMGFQVQLAVHLFTLRFPADSLLELPNDEEDAAWEDADPNSPRGMMHNSVDVAEVNAMLERAKELLLGCAKEELLKDAKAGEVFNISRELITTAKDGDEIEVLDAVTGSIERVTVRKATGAA